MSGVLILRFGTPYRQRILSGALQTKQELDAEFRRIALLEEDVTSVGEIISVLNHGNKNL